MVYLPNFLRQYIDRPASDYVLARDVAAGVAEAFTVPAGANFVVFSSNVDFYAKSGTAAVPGDVTDGTASELNPVGMALYGVSSISVISAAAGKITASFYS